MFNSSSRRLLFGATVACGWVLTGCGSSSGGETPDGGADSKSGADTGSPDTGTDAGTDTGIQDTGAPDSHKAEAGLDASLPDGGPPSTAPITGLHADKWTYVPFADAFCRDGSTTGIGVNMGSSPNVMIFLEGGGACFNNITCNDNPYSFDEADFNMLTGKGMTWMGYSANVGIMDRTNKANPVKDWSFVYVPYCTGDIHGGDNAAPVPGYMGGSKIQYFVGYENMGVYLKRLVPTFTSVKQVLLAGMSGGGFGAAVNYPRVATAFGKIPVTLLDDSGPFMEDTSGSGGQAFLATCLQNDVRKLWGLDKTLLPLCSTCTDPASYFLDFAKSYITANPKVNFGLADSTGDGTITSFFGFGADDCTKVLPESASEFTAGMLDIRSALQSLPNYGEFVFDSTDHTSIQGPEFYTRTAGTGKGKDGGGGVLMTDWVQGLISGKATNPGP